MKSAAVKAWVQASRPKFYIATLIPLFLGWFLARDGGWHPLRFLMVMLGSMIVHLATNLANDYFDYVEGADAGDSIGGSRVIHEGKISLRLLLRVIISLYLLAFLIAFWAMFALDLWGLLPFVLFAFFSSFFYVAPPIRYGYHGLGELFVAVSMGPVMVVGTYWIMAGHPDWRPFYVSIPVGLMVASILYYQSLPDMRTDETVGKYTLAVRLGKRGALLVLILFWVCIYASILGLVAAGLLKWFSVLCLFTLPVFMKMVQTVRRAGDWVELDQHGKYVRMLYFFNGLATIAGVF